MKDGTDNSERAKLESYLGTKVFVFKHKTFTNSLAKYRDMVFDMVRGVEEGRTSEHPEYLGKHVYVVFGYDMTSDEMLVVGNKGLGSHVRQTGLSPITVKGADNWVYVCGVEKDGKPVLGEIDTTPMSEVRAAKAKKDAEDEAKRAQAKIRYEQAREYFKSKGKSGCPAALSKDMDAFCDDQTIDFEEFKRRYERYEVGKAGSKKSEEPKKKSPEEVAAAQEKEKERVARVKVMEQVMKEVYGSHRVTKNNHRITSAFFSGEITEEEFRHQMREAKAKDDAEKSSK
jgi:hypothetical protein